MSQQHAGEVSSGERFEFGKNWAAFLKLVDDRRIRDAEESLAAMLETADLSGKRFIDIGCGSGLFSLAARRMGATVHSFDYDPHSYNCTKELRQRYFSHDENWKVEQGSVLDQDYLKSLGTFDIVYSWGVLHHTGQMWQALANVAPMVAPGGRLFIALYNDQGGASRRWTWVKRMYNKHPMLRMPILLGSFWRLYWRGMLKDLALLRPGHIFREQDKNNRGMAVWRNLVDWVGGYPFEVCKAEQVFDFYRERNFALTRLFTDDGLGCHQFVFVKTDRKI